MKNDSLVKEILKDIANRIADESIKINGQEVKKRVAPKVIPVVFSGYSNELNDIFNELKQFKRYGFQLVIVLSKEAEKKFGKELFQKEIFPLKIYTEEDQDCCEKLIDDAEFVILMAFTQNIAAKLRFGIQDTIDTVLVWRALWEGKPVFANQQNIKTLNGKPCKNQRLAKIADENNLFLKEAGVSFFEDQGYLRCIMSLYPKISKIKDQTSNNKIEKIKKQVITEKEILEAVGKTEHICIHKDSIITPLAMDTARDKKIKITRE